MQTSSKSIFCKFYDRGDLPIAVEHSSGRAKLAWKVDPKDLDYHYYLPLFFDGIRETAHPYCLLARQGATELLDNYPGKDTMVAVLPRLIIPIKSALNTRNPNVVRDTLIILQKLAKCEGVAEALVPYHRQILPVLNIYKQRNLNCGDVIDYGQSRREKLGDLIGETLTLLESLGGQHAYSSIKHMIPTYESCTGKTTRTQA